MALDLSKFIQRFIDEAREHLDLLYAGIANLKPGAEDDIHGLFRSAHTLKGSARMLKLVPISTLAHHVEDILGDLREGKRTPDPQLVTVLIDGLDAIAQRVEQLVQNPDAGALQPPEPELLTALSSTSCSGGPAVASGPAPATTGRGKAPPVDSGSGRSASAHSRSTGTASSQAPVAVTGADRVRLPVAKLDELVRLVGEVVFSHERSQERLYELSTLALRARQSDADVTEDLRELVIRVKDDVLQQGLLMHELHQKALVLRMLPVSMVFEPAARSLRDLARSIGKKIDCRVLGGEIELDRQIIDRIAEPLVHLLRNAADHGIETPEERAAVGKPARGTVQLSARQDGGWVVIEIADDGVGISLPALRAKAVAKGLLTAVQADQASDQQLFSLVFEPGFSTSPIITDISGRGVGMDVVRRILVDELHGAVDVSSVPGHGTTFTLRVPLSLALMRVVLLRSAGATFAFTAQQVVELLRIPESELVTVAERQALIRHNEFIPVVELAALVGQETLAEAAGSRTDSKGRLLIILRIREEKLALAVDEIVAEHDVLIKPVPAHMSRLPLLAGLVVTGRNEVVSVLHAGQLLERARRLRAQQTLDTPETEHHGPSEWHVLVVDDSLNTREIERDVLEASGYRVTLAEDGLDGWTKAMAHPYDAILTDVEMPHMDGFTLTARLRGEKVYQHRPIVIITSREREEDKRRGIDVGADAYIVKGEFDKNSLVETLRALLG